MTDQKPSSVYIVEDLELLSRGLQLVIEKCPELKYVGTSASGKDAISRVSALCPDIVLMDICLPDIDGISATAAVKKNNPSTRVIILSATDDPETVLRAIEAGASAYCLKNAPNNKLRLAISSVLAGAFWLDDILAERVVECVSLQRKLNLKHVSCQNDLISPISQREMEVLQHLCEGLRNKEIARRLGISVSTVRTHIVHITEKLGASSRTDIAMKAHRTGLIA